MQIEAPPYDLKSIQNATRIAGELIDLKTMWVSPTWLWHASGCADNETWQEGLSAMIEFARKHNWVRYPTGEIHAHVVWV